MDREDDLTRENQALLAYGACRPDQGGPAQAHDVRAVGALCGGRPDHRLCRTPRDTSRQSGKSYRFPVQVDRRAIDERGARADLRTPAETGLGLGGRGRRTAHTHRHKRHSRPVGRRRRQSNLHLHREPRRLPDAEVGCTRNRTASDSLSRHAFSPLCWSRVGESR